MTFGIRATTRVPVSRKGKPLPQREHEKRTILRGAAAGPRVAQRLFNMSDPVSTDHEPSVAEPETRSESTTTRARARTFLLPLEAAAPDREEWALA